MTLASALGILGSYLAVGALQFGVWVVVRRRWVSVLPGWCFQSGAMRPRTLRYFVRRYAIDTVFDFRGATDAHVAQERAVLEACGVCHVNIPCGRSPDAASIETFVRRAAEEYARGRRILLHCKDGQGRAIFFAAVSLMEFAGTAPHDAYLAVRRLPPSLRWIKYFVPRAGLLGPKNPKYRMILDYKPVSRREPVTAVPNRDPLQEIAA